MRHIYFSRKFWKAEAAWHVLILAMPSTRFSGTPPLSFLDRLNFVEQWYPITAVYLARKR